MHPARRDMAHGVWRNLLVLGETTTVNTEESGGRADQRVSSSDDILKKVSMAPPARQTVSQPAHRTVAATAAPRQRRTQFQDTRRSDAASAQLDWLQPALALWLRDEASSGARMGDVPQAAKR